MITIEEFMKTSQVYKQVHDKACEELREVINGRYGEMGLVAQEVRVTKEYKEVKQKVDFTFKMMRNYNKSVPNKIKREASMIRRQEKIDKNK